MEPNISHLVRAGHVTTVPQDHVILAAAPRRAALAALYGLADIQLLRGQFRLYREADGVIAAALKMQARVTQICVVTLAAFEARIEEEAALRFVPARQPSQGEPVELDAETLEGPDEIVYSGETIDLDAALAEQLALTLDPYPRKPGAVLAQDRLDTAADVFAPLRGKWPRRDAT